MAKAAITACCFVELVNFNKLNAFDSLDHELGNAVTFFHRERMLFVSVVQDAGNLTVIARVNEPRSIEASNAMVERKTTSRHDEPGKTLRQRNGDARWHEFPPTWSNGGGHARAKINTSIAGLCRNW
jgi:hypothetical protein